MSAKDAQLHAHGRFKYTDRGRQVEPASRLPQFNRAALKDRLSAIGIADLFLGVELGGRLKGGCIPDYDLMAASPLVSKNRC